MAGHEVVYGLDNNQDAIDTFKRNFPNSTAVCKKIEDFDIRDLPPCDIIVGGPPCVNFSTSKGSRANVLEGVKLVQAFMRVVYYKKPKYWIMENIPRIGLHLPEKIPLRWIGINEEGEFKIPIRREFDIMRYGAPQKRKRLLLGNYPIPKETYGNVNAESLNFDPHLKPIMTLGNIIKSFPPPGSCNPPKFIIDPNYGFELATVNLTDHFMDTIIDDIEAENLFQVKTQHPYMGRMNFPDDMEKPARTVVSLQMGRETLVIQVESKKYRRTTIRECATLQTFPISFQFAGETLSSRYKQAGNAVPPILTFQIAKKITEIEHGIDVHSPIIYFPQPFKKARASIPRPRSEPNYKASRTIRIPKKEVRGTRIELTSHGYPSINWNVTLHLGEGKKNHVELNYELPAALKMVKDTLVQNSTTNVIELFHEFVEYALSKHLPNGLDIHKAIHLTRKQPTAITDIEMFLDKNFPVENFSGVNIKVVNAIPGLLKSILRMRILIMIPIMKIICLRLNGDRSFVQKQTASISASKRGLPFIEDIPLFTDLETFRGAYLKISDN